MEVSGYSSCSIIALLKSLGTTTDAVPGLKGCSGTAPYFQSTTSHANLKGNHYCWTPSHRHILSPTTPFTTAISSTLTFTVMWIFCATQTPAENYCLASVVGVLWRSKSSELLVKSFLSTKFMALQYCRRKSRSTIHVASVDKEFTTTISAMNFCPGRYRAHLVLP